MAGYIGSKASVTVTSPETDSRYVNTSGDTMTSDLDVEGNITSDNGNGNFVSLTTDGAIEIKKSNGQGYIDFKDGNEDLDCRIAQYSNGLQFTTGGSGAPTNAMTIDSSGRVGVGLAAPVKTLHLHEDAGTNAVLHMTNSTTGSADTNGFSLISQQTSKDVILTQRESAALILRTSDVERVRVQPTGYIKTPYQPACIAHTGAGWFNVQVNTSYGIGGFHYNRGGFYTGGAIGGYNVVHVPATGLYRVGLSLYVAANNDGRRLYVKKNNATDVCFIQTTQSTVDNTQFQENIIEMNAGDYLNYHVLFGNVNSYHDYVHTYVKIEYMG